MTIHTHLLFGINMTRIKVMLLLLNIHIYKKTSQIVFYFIEHLKQGISKFQIPDLDSILRQHINATCPCNVTYR